METIKIKYADLCEVLFSNGSVETFVSEKYCLECDDLLTSICGAIKKRFLPHYKQKLKTVNFNRDKFKNKFFEWMKGEFIFTLPDNQTDCESQLRKPGRPTKGFDQCCERSRRSKVRALQASHSQDLIDAAASSYQPISQAEVFSADFALSIFTQAKLSRFQYEVIRAATKKVGHNIFPSYKKIQEAKKDCYPSDVNITESSAEILLQSLVDHTVKRILKTKQDEELDTLKNSELVLHMKWGFDGSSGQNEFSQPFFDDSETRSDSNLFMTSIVPLKITLVANQDEEIWVNPRPSSTRYCRPIRFQFLKETAELIRSEKERVQNEINNLRPTILQHDNSTITVRHVLHFTMLDGKVAQHVTNTTASSNCFVCGARPSEMNDISKLEVKFRKEEAIQLGISPLHARIKFMEYILHLGYNLEFQSWRTTKTTLPIKETAKERIQKRFITELGIKVDFVKQGCGSSNTGNTSRVFFRNPSLTAEITQVSENLIRRLGVILEVINSNSSIDSEKFKSYATETAKLAIEMYPWYYMPSTVHKILIHGAEIIEAAVLPIGLLSEEAQESRNKDYKYYRLHFTRKCSRTATNEDVFHKLLESSDPYITYMRPEPKKKHLPISDEALQLIM